MSGKHEKLKSATILFVEDDAMTHETFGRLLKRRVKELYAALNGQEAIDIFTQHPDSIDIVITDLDMPIKNGFELIDDIQKLKSDQKIIVISAFKNDYSRENVQQYFSIEKPIIVKEVLNKLEDML